VLRSSCRRLPVVVVVAVFRRRPDKLRQYIQSHFNGCFIRIPPQKTFWCLGRAFVSSAGSMKRLSVRPSDRLSVCLSRSTAAAACGRFAAESRQLVVVFKVSFFHVLLQSVCSVSLCVRTTVHRGDWSKFKITTLAETESESEAGKFASGDSGKGGVLFAIVFLRTQTFLSYDSSDRSCVYARIHDFSYVGKFSE